jgi:hypothetical protein
VLVDEGGFRALPCWAGNRAKGITEFVPGSHVPPPVWQLLMKGDAVPHIIGFTDIDQAKKRYRPSLLVVSALIDTIDAGLSRNA